MLWFLSISIKTLFTLPEIDSDALLELIITLPHLWLFFVHGLMSQLVLHDLVDQKAATLPTSKMLAPLSKRLAQSYPFCLAVLTGA